MVKNLSIVAVLMMCLLAGLIISDYLKLPSKELVIFYTSNLRGQIKPFSGVVLDHKYDQAGGLAFIKGYIERMSKAFNFKPENTLLLDTGDALFGTAEATLTMGDVPLRLMAKAGYDAMAIGNMEFEYGFDALKGFINSNLVPMLACNYRDVSAPVSETFKPGIIVEKAGTKIGIIGLGHAELARNTRQDNIENVEIINMVTSVQNTAANLKAKGAELIILLSHHPVTAENKNVSELFPDVDVIIGDMISSTISNSAKPVLCNTASSRGGGIGLTKISYNAGKWDVLGLYNRVFAVNAAEIPPDKELSEEIARVESKVDGLLEETITESKGVFNHSYTEESTIGSLIADCMKEVSGAQIALTNSGGIKTSLGEGKVSLRKLFNIMPFENNLVVVELTGAQLENIIETSLSGKTGFLQSAGINCTYSGSNPAGFRIIQIDIGEQPLEFDSTYTVAINDFMFNNKIDWPEFSQGKNASIKGLIRENLVNHLRKRQFISPETKRRFNDFQELDETLRIQSLAHSLVELEKEITNDGTSNSEYCRLLAEILRLETQADFAFVPVDIIRRTREPLKSITPSRILSDFSANNAISVMIIELDGATIKNIVQRGLEKNSTMPTAFAGFSAELDDNKDIKIHPWNNSFAPDRIYKVAINDGFPLKIEGLYNISKANLSKYSSDIRRTFINGLRSRNGQVEIKRVLY